MVRRSGGEDLGVVFGRSEDGFALVDGTRFVWVNSAFARLFGQSAEALEGAPIGGALLGVSEPILKAWRDDAERSPVEVEVEVDGAVRLVSLVPIRALEVEGRVLEGWLARDTTDERRSQVDLMVADRMMSIGALAAGVAHDINNPLSYVLGNLDFVRDELGALLREDRASEAAEVMQALDEAKEGADRVRRIVSDLRAFARADAGSVRALDPRRVVESAVNMAFSEIRHRARLEKDLQAVPPVRGNEARLGQLFLNLLLNAVEAVRGEDKAHSLIRVSTWTESGWACVGVEDNGPGLSPERVGQLFDPAFPAGPRGLRRGLGLAMARAVVTELGGSLDVEPRDEGGSRFVARLPADPDPTESKDRPAPDDEAGAGEGRPPVSR